MSPFSRGLTAAPGGDIIRCMSHRFHVEKLGESERLVLGAGTARHLDVLGLGAGSEVVLFDGTGAEAVVRIERLSRTSAEACVLRRSAPRTDAGPEVTLASAVPKGRRMDILVRMCAELGVRHIVPLVTGRSVVRPAADTPRSHRLDRWRKICTAAAEQSGHTLLTTVEPPADLTAILPHIGNYDLTVLLSPDAAAPTLAEVLTRRADAKTVLMLVGPEGGWTPEEVSLAVGRGAEAARLTRDILRLETACVAASAVMMALLGDAGAPGSDA